MTLEAQRLCEEKGHPFTAVFGQQWVLTETDPGGLETFSAHKLGSWTLKTGPDLDVAAAHDGSRGISVAVLGQAVDLAGDYVTDQVLEAHLMAAGSEAELADTLTMIAGRYAFIIAGPRFQRLYLDPSSCLGAVYDPSSRIAAASLYMALERDLVPNTEFPYHDLASIGGGRYAFGVTPDARVRRLMANHFLDLKDFTPHRHWPHPDMDLTCPMTVEAIEERVQTVIDRHHVILRALTGAVHPSMLALSGGADSRVLLALSAGMLERYEMFFVHRANWIGQRDAALAAEMADAAGVDLTLFDVVEDDSLKRRPRFGRRMNERRKLAMGILEGGPDEKHNEILVRQALPPGGAVFRGNVTDVSKAVLWRPVGIREFLRTGGTEHDPSIGVRLLMLGGEGDAKNPWCLEAYRAWQAGLPENAGPRALDFSSLEHFRSHGQGAFFYATNRNFYQTPSADRTIMEALISLPPHIRDSFYINDMIIEREAPELLNIPYTARPANEVRQKRLPLEELLANSPARI